jgi:hyperosmotically inducible periplasmic protein
MGKIVCLILAAATLGLAGCTTATRYSRSTGQYIDDMTMANRVERALNRDSLTRAADIGVDTFRGNIHLTGFVDHPLQKQRASEVASFVPGVEWFKNDIIVKSEIPAGQEIREAAGAERPLGSSMQGGEGWQRGHAYIDRENTSYRQGVEFREPAATGRATERKTEVEVERK